MEDVFDGGAPDAIFSETSKLTGAASAPWTGAGVAVMDAVAAITGADAGMGWRALAGAGS